MEYGRRSGSWGNASRRLPVVRPWRLRGMHVRRTRLPYPGRVADNVLHGTRGATAIIESSQRRFLQPSLQLIVAELRRTRSVCCHDVQMHILPSRLRPCSPKMWAAKRGDLFVSVRFIPFALVFIGREARFHPTHSSKPQSTQSDGVPSNNC